MRRPLLLLLLAAGAAAVVAPAGGTAPRPAPTRAAATPPPAPTPEQLVAELGDPDYPTRERAEAALRERGPSALSAVRAATSSSDSEVRRRALTLLPGLETRALLEPRRVTLPPKPLTLDDALVELARQTACSVVADPPGGPERLMFGVTDLPFWEAVERVAALTGRAVASGEAGQPLRLEPRAARPAFVAVDGAFRIELTAAHEDRDVDYAAPGPGGRRGGTLALTLTVRAEPRLGILAARPARITGATDDRGRALAAAPDGEPRSCGLILWWPGALGPPAAAATTEAHLSRPARDGERLRAVAGSVPVRAVVDRRRVVVPNAAAAVGKPLAVGNEAVAVRRFERTAEGGLSVAVQVPLDGDGASEERWRSRVIVEDMWGSRVPPAEPRAPIFPGRGGWAVAGGSTGEIQSTYARPAGWLNTFSPNLVLEAWVVAEHHVKFEFRDVPLP